MDTPTRRMMRLLIEAARKGQPWLSRSVVMPKIGEGAYDLLERAITGGWVEEEMQRGPTGYPRKMLRATVPGSEAFHAATHPADEQGAA